VASSPAPRPVDQAPHRGSTPRSGVRGRARPLYHNNVRDPFASTRDLHAGSHSAEQFVVGIAGRPARSSSTSPSRLRRLRYAMRLVAVQIHWPTLADLPGDGGRPVLGVGFLVAGSLPAALVGDYLAIVTSLLRQPSSLIQVNRTHRVGDVVLGYHPAASQNHHDNGPNWIGEHIGDPCPSRCAIQNSNRGRLQPSR